MKALTFITSHPLKAKELALHLDVPVTHHQLDLPEMQSLDPVQVATAKAQEAYRRLKRPVLVEDFSIRFEALGNLPGPLIKWFLSELGPEGLCKLLDGYATRRAFAQTCFALCDHNGVHIFDGMMEGVIAPKPRGDKGYGTDAIFIPNGQSKTWGQMSSSEQITYSLRSIGLQKLGLYLRK